MRRRLILLAAALGAAGSVGVLAPQAVQANSQAKTCVEYRAPIVRSAHIQIGYCP
jgi:Flp pilus assembly protein CpaB